MTFLFLILSRSFHLITLIFTEPVQNGLPPSLSQADFNANLNSLHAANARTQHPAQPQVLGQQAATSLMGPTHLPPSTVAVEEEISFNAAEAQHKPAPPKPVAAKSNPPLPTHQLGDSQGEEQEVTQRCPILGCPWTSYKTADPTMLEACVKSLSIHMTYEHDTHTGNFEVTNTGRTDRAHREYMAATKPRTIVKTLDDATSNLTEGRFLPMPLDMKVLGRSMPLAIKPENTILDMSHVGVDVTNADTLRKCHDRTLLTKKLKEFSDHNLRASHSAGDALVAVEASKDSLKMGKELKHLANTEECVRAFYNFLALSHNFHVLDYSPMALMKLVLEKQFTGPPTVDQYQKMFEKYVHDSANRAHKKNAPPTYTDLLLIWNAFITPNSMNSTSIEAVVDKRVTKLLEQGAAGGGGGRNRGRERDNRGSPGGPPLKKPNTSFCPTWNVNTTYPLCTNQAASGGCTDGSGKFLKHSCNSFNNLTKQICKSSMHGKQFH